MKFRTEVLGERLGSGKIFKHAKYLANWRHGDFKVKVLEHKWGDVYEARILETPPGFDPNLGYNINWLVGKTLAISECFLKRRL
jgi:hypothetical protein